MKSTAAKTIKKKPAKKEINDDSFPVAAIGASAGQPDAILPGKNNSNVKDRRIKKLEEELAAARAEMHSLSLEQAVFNKELQSANKELQRVNEELITTNQELQTRNDLLAESYDYSECIIATLHEPMIILDNDLRVKSANKSFYKKFCIKKEETEGKLLYDLTDKQWNIPRLRELLEDIIPKNSPIHDFEVTHDFPGLGEKILLLNANRIVQKSRNEHLILLAINDVSERALVHRKEKDLLEKDNFVRKVQNIKLEETVEERTEQLEEANENLKEKNKELKEMNKELHTLTYISSHDMQEPLRKIQTFASRILGTEHQNLSGNGKDYLTRMIAAAGRMRQLINDLLAYSSINFAEKKFVKTDLNRIVEEIKTELKKNLEEKQATIDTTNGLCTIRVIPFQVRQLLYNLIDNALKFSRPGIPPRIIIKSKTLTGNKSNYRKLSPKKDYCHISIKDNGIGFEPQYNESIFEVLKRLHGKEEYAGTGIGLAIVKKIVENHHGYITATGKLNEGATFDIYMPIDEK